MSRWLFEMGLDCRVANKQGHTALHKAAYKGHSMLVKWLLEVVDIDPALKDEGGYTPGAIAAEQGHTALARMLDEAAGTENEMEHVGVHVGPLGVLDLGKVKGEK